MKATPQSSEYLKSAVLTATPEQLQLMLYDGAIRFLLKGQDAIKAGDREASFHALDRAQSIVLELNNGIRREANPELADQFMALHLFIYRRLVAANLDRDQTALEEALRILRYQRETWLLLMQKVAEVHAAVETPDRGGPVLTRGGPSRTSPVSTSGADEGSGFVAEA